MSEEDTKKIRQSKCPAPSLCSLFYGSRGRGGRGTMVGNPVYTSWQRSIFSSYPHWKIMLLINQNLIQKGMKAECRRSQPENTLYLGVQSQRSARCPAETRSHSSMRGRDKPFRNSLRAPEAPQQWNWWCLNLLRSCVGPTQSSPLRSSKNSHWGGNWDHLV